VNPAELLRIGELFDALRWPTHVEKEGPIPHLFDKFARMWSRLDQEQRDLLFEITKSYVWVRPEARAGHFLAAWRNMMTQLPPNIETVAIVPLLKPGSKQPKSSSSVYYDFAEGYRSKLIEDVAPRELALFKSMGSFSARFAGGSNIALLLVDDYVGSGDTAEAALAKVPKLESSTIMVLALVAQSRAVGHLQARNYTLVANLILGRGISDNTSLPDIDNALKVMDKLGRKLGIKKNDRLGYRATEALVAMTRTPNNTFPVYWTNKKVKDIVWDSPFTRFTDYGH
jgi:hypothetical protein